MASAIRISEPSRGGPRRLSLFAGRSLGESEFDVLQATVAARCGELLAGSRPGILHGLQVEVDGEGRLRIAPGLALGSDGRPIRLFAPLTVDWEAVVEEYRARTEPGESPAPLTGWFRLTLKRGTLIVDPPVEGKAAVREELDILRESRLETVATLDLHPVAGDPALLSLPVRRALNRLAVRALAADLFDAPDGAVPLALVRVEDDAIATEDGDLVVDAAAGRYLARPHAAHLALAARFALDVERFERSPRALAVRPLPGGFPGARPRPVLRPGIPTLRPGPGEFLRPRLPSDRFFDPSLQFDPSRPLSEQLGVDYLPAAGPFPRGLVRRLAGRPDGTGWSGPELRFDPLDLQIEMVPIRASEVDAAIARELPRGVVDLVNGQGDRIRLLVAVPPADYAADLMDLPQIDTALAEAVHRRAEEARSAWQDWASLYVEIFGGLDDGAVTDGNVTDEGRARLKPVRIPAPPAGALPTVEADPAARRELGVPAPIATPPDGASFFSAIVAARQREADARGEPLPRPWAAGAPPAPEDLDPVPVGIVPEDGLYARRARLLAEIRALEDELDANDRLVADFDVFIRAQRQGFDAVTVSFTAIAGGVPGDGSGLQLAKWMPFTDLAIRDEE